MPYRRGSFSWADVRDGDGAALSSCYGYRKMVFGKRNEAGEMAMACLLVQG